ncbi:hypothetical protein IV500_00090 [Paeniglutamicibacter antarcticus]|uniref:Uncharacterized protein n=1 Tax=Arthrobacter terrae TaxID=2935737 RepID=A0A931CN14_9MICC|nr:hypothetical protein [Arthrobacter terrae]MBG0737844.1 hypothetical protein [Arthrobacter terrae]
MSETPENRDPATDDEEARDSLAGDFSKFLDPDIADLDEDAGAGTERPNPDRR